VFGQEMTLSNLDSSWLVQQTRYEHTQGACVDDTVPMNTVHCSDSLESAEREISLFFKDDEIFECQTNTKKESIGTASND